MRNNRLCPKFHVIELGRPAAFALEVREGFAVSHIEKAADFACLAVAEYLGGAVLGEKKVEFFQRFSCRFLFRL